MPGPGDPSRPLHLDCDTGIDDALALLYLLRSPATNLVGVSTVSGNTTAARAARNTLDLLALAGRGDVPVAVGAHDPLARPFGGGAPHVHGGNGVGDVELPRSGTEPVTLSGPELIVRSAREHPGRLRLLAVGPATNVALALALEPALPQLVAEVTLMAGAALVPGNITPVAEANVFNDAGAAAAVLTAGWPVTLVLMDATMRQMMEEKDRLRLAEDGGPLARAAAGMLDRYFSFYEPQFGRRCSPVHDPLAAAVATGEEVPESAPVVDVVVDTGDGPGHGQTICDLRGLYAGFPARPGARTRVVLRTPAGFPDRLVDRVVAA